MPASVVDAWNRGTARKRTTVTTQVSPVTPAAEISPAVVQPVRIASGNIASSTRATSRSRSGGPNARTQPGRASASEAS